MRYRDVRPIWEVILQMSFYGSPILYPIEKIPDESLQRLIMCSPLAVIVQQARHAIIDADAPSAAEAMGGAVWLLIPLASLIGVCVLGLRRLRPLRPAHRRGTLTVERGDVVVVVPVYGARELFEECLRSVVANTTPGTRIVVADDASPDPEIEAFARQGSTAAVEYVRREQNLGFVGNMNAAFRDTAPADVVIVNSDTVVPPAWLERLRARRLQRRARGDREHAHQPRHDPLGPRLEAPVAASRRRG